LSFTPTQAGQHQVSVNFRGKHLQGSPFNLEVIDGSAVYRRDYRKVSDRPVSRFGSNGAGGGLFQFPSSVASNSKGEIVVADDCNHRIQIFDEKGTFLRVFGSCGHGDGQFTNPRGVVVDQQGNYVVVDSLNHCIQIFNSQGQFVRKFGFKGEGNGQMSRPR